MKPTLEQLKSKNSKNQPSFQQKFAAKTATADVPMEVQPRTPDAPMEVRDEQADISDAPVVASNPTEPITPGPTITGLQYFSFALL